MNIKRLIDSTKQPHRYINLIPLKVKVSLLTLLIAFSWVSGQESLKVNSSGEYQNIVCIKFKSNKTNHLDNLFKGSKSSSYLSKSKKDSYLKIGLSDLDAVSNRLNITSMKRVFRPGGKHEEKHRKFGLHLWYQLVFESTEKMKSVIKQLQKATSVEIAHALHETQLIEDSYSIPIEDPINSGTNLQVTSDPLYINQWHYNNTGQEGGIVGKDINLERAWEIEKGNKGVVVAINDTGIDVTHPDLIRNLWVNEGEIKGNNVDDDQNGYVDDIYGYNFISNSGNIPPGSHGTHVAGTVAAETNNGIGVAGIAGGSGNGDGVRLMACVFPGGSVADAGAEAFVYAADNGAVISQNSWSFGQGPENLPLVTAHKEAVRYFIENAGGENQAMKGGIVFFAAANYSSNVSRYPNNFDPVIMVAALNNKDQKPGYSNYGDWVDISAPGGQSGGGIYSTLPDGTYGYSQGTSMACPHASGVAALVVSNNYGNITPEQVSRTIEGTTDPLDHLNPGFEGQLGHGRINAFKALQIGNAPEIPLFLKVMDITKTSASISWKPIEAATFYRLRYRKTTENSWVIVDTEESFLTLTTLEEGKPYEIQVQTQAPVSSGFSYSLEFTTKVTSLEAPQEVFYSNITEIKAKINWLPVPGASGYVLDYKEEGDTEWTSIIVNEGTLVYINDFSQNTKYFVRIKATNGTTTSAYSALSSFRTIPSKCGNIPFWKRKQYATAGTQVAHEDIIYENKWWAQAHHVPGVHEVWLKIRDCDNAQNIPPTVTITSPSDGDIIVQETLSGITLTANPVDSDGIISTIQFQVDDHPLSLGNNFSWLPPTFGSYTIKVTVTDDKGATGTDQINITIKQKTNNQPPIVDVSQPADEQVFEQEVLTAITLSANASDSDGTVDSIQFEVNDTALTQGNNISWTPTAFGTYTIKVTATDDKGASTTHQISITIKQTNTGGDCNGIPAWDPSAIYPSEGGVKVSHNNNIYQNKWWTQNEEPGTSGPWGSWELLEPCPSSLSASSAVQNQEMVSVFPNPTRESLQLSITTTTNGFMKIALHSVSGKYTKTLSNAYTEIGKHSYSYNISSLSKGLYVLKIKTQNEIVIKKIIID